MNDQTLDGLPIDEALANAAIPGYDFDPETGEYTPSQDQPEYVAAMNARDEIARPTEADTREVLRLLIAAADEMGRDIPDHRCNPTPNERPFWNAVSAARKYLAATR